MTRNLCIRHSQKLLQLTVEVIKRTKNNVTWAKAVAYAARYRSANRVRKPSHLRLMAARSMWALQEVEEHFGLVQFLKTLVAFVGACALAPCLLVVYFVVNSVRSIWYQFLEKRFPEVQFVRSYSVRTAIDTRRNQGIITLLLQVKGNLDPDFIKDKLQNDILNRRDEKGQLVFPHLRTVLTTRWGQYAWEKKDFNINNHLVVGSPVYRGRAITESTIQDYVSDIVSKYLPPDTPPWQVVLIPTMSAEEKFYILIRLHHLVAEGLALKELLKTTLPDFWSHSTATGASAEHGANRPLFKSPVALMKIWHQFQDGCKNKWEELVSNYDPLENPAILKSPSLFSCVMLVVITCASIASELRCAYLKGVRVVSNETQLTQWIKFILVTLPDVIQKELDRRQCVPHVIGKQILKALDPTDYIYSTMKYPLPLIARVTQWSWWISTLGFRLTYTLLREYRVFVKGENPNYNLAYNALQEAWYLWRIIFAAPRLVLEEFMQNTGSSHQLQTVSLCGRKVVAWSDPVEMEFVMKLKEATGATINEILMTAASGALREYYRQFGLVAPESVMATVPVHTDKFSDLTGTQGSGFVTMSLPTLQDDALNTLGLLQHRLKNIRRQPALYLASVFLLENLARVLPSMVVRLLLNYFTRKYAVMLTNVEIGEPGFQLWNQEIENVVIWRPPQSNISMSLTLMTYQDKSMLGVMADRQLCPQHSALATGFVQQLNDIALATGVPPVRIRPRSRSGSPRLSPRTSPRPSPRASPPTSPSTGRSSFLFPPVEGSK